MPGLRSMRVPFLMRGVLALLLALPVVQSLPAGARPWHRRLAPYGCCGYAPNADPFDTDIPPIVVPPERPPSFVVPPGEGPESTPPFVPGPSARPGPAPYPQGFALDVPVTAGEGGSRPTGTLDRYREVADALAACWAPPAAFDDTPWRDITLRVSFKRDGTVNGVPRIPHVDQGLTGQARSDLTRSLMDALQRCTPLPFSPGLGGAIAGQVFALRFIRKDQD